MHGFGNDENAMCKLAPELAILHWRIARLQLAYIAAMSDYRRNHVPGGTYFFTLVTYHRRNILTLSGG